MMGYSVTEAASVLGVPTERVWELIARGVLSGEPEGETGMRVFLQPRPAPAPVTSPDDPVTARSNGPEREMSPFRELLTEFRSLTERYGQALLALGESRGEVASLRSRVDVLEARIEFRLPMGPPSAAPWPTQSLPVSEPASASGAPAEAAVEHDDEEAHRPRRRGARRATESFAEALARAEDPSLADLPRGSEADALAAFRSETEAAAAVDADRVLPRQVLPAEPMLVVEEPEAVADEAKREAEVAEMPEVAEAPDVIEAWAGPVETPAAPDDVGPEPIQPEPEHAQPGAVEAEEPVAAGGDEDTLIATLPAVEPEPWPEFEAMTATPHEEEEPDQAVHEPEPEMLASVEPEPDAVEPVKPEREALELAESQPESDPQAAIEPADFDAERYTTVIEQPDWLEAEVDDAWPAETDAGDETRADMGEAGASTTGAVPEATESAELPADDQVPASNEVPEESVKPSSDDEPGWSAPDSEESGAEEMEMAGSGGQGTPVHDEPEPETGLPGSRELDEALGAFGPVAGRAPGDLPIPPDDEWPPASAGNAEPRRWPPARGSFASGQAPESPYSPTRAYRRLRRIFPT